MRDADLFRGNQSNTYGSHFFILSFDVSLQPLKLKQTAHNFIDTCLFRM